MRISKLGGEFELIKRISKKMKNYGGVKVGIGDDTAVLKYDKNNYMLLTTDMMIEGDHFSLKWSSPEQIGMKAMECNVSDIAAMGGKPKYALVSLSLPKSASVEFVDGLYKGINRVGKRYGCSIIGGDTTHGDEMVISIAMLGVVKKKYICLRSDAKPGDLIYVSGPLGESKAGLELLLNGMKGDAIKYHLEPRSRMDVAQDIAKYANAMEDVSDGLAAEVKNICEQSKTGAIIFVDSIPLSDNTIKAALKLGKNPADFALYGGEDFELVYTVSPKNILKAKGRLVGEITKGRKVRLHSNGKQYDLKKSGYDHFR